MAKWQPDSDGRAMIEELIAEEKKEGSAARFARRFMPWTDSKWIGIKKVVSDEAESSYFDLISKPDRLMEQLAKVLRNVRVARARAAADAKVHILELDGVRAVAKAVNQCRAKPGADRLIKYVTETGGGKTHLCKHLAATEGAAVVNGRSSWRHSRYWAEIDIAGALGVPIGNETDPAKIENLLISETLNQAIVLAIDEGEYIGRDVINLLIQMLNQTTWVIVLCSNREPHDLWMSYYRHEAKQLQRRTHALIRVTGLTRLTARGEVTASKDVARFFPEKQFAAELPALKLIAEEASRFGHFDLIARVAEALGDSPAAELAEVAQAIHDAQVDMGAPALNVKPFKEKDSV